MRLSDGTLRALGDSSYGQLNLPWSPSGVTWQELAAGGFHTVARLSDGTVSAWGRNDYGQCSPPTLTAGLTFVQLASGMYHSVARVSDGAIVGWGNNGSGQCSTPALPAGVSYVDVAAGQWHTVARRSDGSAVAWGWNGSGQCNVPVLPAGTTYTDVAAGFYHTVARRSDGQVVAWGDDMYGQCDVPPLPAGMRYTAISAGYVNTVALYDTVCTVPTVYCTAKQNSLGCVPSIAMSGMPSASAGSGCTVQTSNVLGKKSGLFFHGVNGALNAPFHGGFLCVAPPFIRHAVVSSGGTTGACDGAFTEDLSAYIASGADPALVAGAQVWIQTWSRDPGDAFGDSLSDAVTAAICP
jgi:hypothetical protein